MKKMAHRDHAEEEIQEYVVEEEIGRGSEVELECHRCGACCKSFSLLLSPELLEQNAFAASTSK